VKKAPYQLVNISRENKTMNPDIIGFQETKANNEQVIETICKIEGYHLYISSAERPGYSGTAVLSKTKAINFIEGLGIDEHDKEGRTITLEFEKFYLINSYIPNSGSELARLDYREKWDSDMLAFIQKLENHKPVLLMGDLNVAHQPIDLANPKSNYNKSAGYTQREIDGLSNYLKAGMIDTFRHFYPDTIKYSWWSFRAGARSKNIGWRIDYVLVSKGFEKSVKEAFILNEVMGSDHCPVGIAW
jgi:exodeoxyribonuclease-3